MGGVSFIHYISNFWDLAVDHSQRTKRLGDEVTLFRQSGAPLRPHKGAEREREAKGERERECTYSLARLN